MDFNFRENDRIIKTLQLILRQKWITHQFTHDYTQFFKLTLHIIQIDVHDFLHFQWNLTRRLWNFSLFEQQ